MRRFRKITSSQDALPTPVSSSRRFFFPLPSKSTKFPRGTGLSLTRQQMGCLGNSLCPPYCFLDSWSACSKSSHSDKITCRRKERRPREPRGRKEGKIRNISGFDTDISCICRPFLWFQWTRRFSNVLTHSCGIYSAGKKERKMGRNPKKNLY